MSDSFNPMDCICQALLSTGFSWQEYWSGLPFPSPGIFPAQGSNPWSMAGGLYCWAMWEAQYEFIHADKPALRGAPTKVHPPVDGCLLPYHNTDRSSHGWALWWAELTLAPLLSSCLGASLISDLPKRKKSKWEKEILLQALNKHLWYWLLEVQVLWSNVPKRKAFGRNQHGPVPLRPKH